MMNKRWIIFDVDGTLFDKRREYVPGKGTVEDHHELLRCSTYARGRRFGLADEEKAIDDVVEAYAFELQRKTLSQTLDSMHPEFKKEYTMLASRYGSNGKVFEEEFGASPGFFAKVIEQCNLEELLAQDEQLINTIDRLKEKGYGLGIMSSDTFKTIDTALRSLGLEIKDFQFPDHKKKKELYDNTGDAFPILCSENIQNKKPGREGYHKIIRITGAHPEDITYVGDIRTKDIEPPLALGMKAIHVNREENDHYYINSLGHMTYVNRDEKGDGIVSCTIVPELSRNRVEKQYMQVPDIYLIDMVL